MKSGGSATIDVFGSLNDGTISSGASVTVGSSGTFNGTTVNGTVTVMSDGISTNNFYVSGGTLTVSGDGVSFNDSFGSNAVGNIVSGSAVNASIGSDGLVNVSQSGLLNASTIVAGGSAVITSRGTIENSTISGGTVILSGDNGLAKSTNNDYLSGAVVSVNGANILTGDTIENGATATLQNNAYATDVTINGHMTLDDSYGADTVVGNGGQLDAQNQSTIVSLSVPGGTANLASGTTVSGMAVWDNGIVNVASGATLISDPDAPTPYVTVSSGGTAILQNGAIISGTVNVEDGGHITIPTNAGGTIDLQGNTNVGLTISGTGSVNTVISGFNGTAAGNSDGITLTNVKAADIATVTYPDADHVLLTMKDNSSVELNIIGAEKAGYTLVPASDGTLIYEVCFLDGSMISTPDGDVAVETLRAGDAVVAYVNGQPATRRVVWAGKAHGTVRPELADDEAGYPVRILKNAIADGVPYKDMLITAEHCLFLNGKFVPARMLVNGGSIFYDTSITSYDYYHIETEEHSVIMADGMLTESYLDTGNRSAFRQEGDVAVLRRAAVRSWSEDAAAPLCVERAFVEPLFHAIAERQTGTSQTASATTHDADLHLVTKSGAVIRPMRHTGQQFSFMLPPGTESVRIVSRASRMTDTVGPFVDDRRMLGVAVADVMFVTANQNVDIIAHLQAEKPAGWHAAEAADYAWTNGDAVLPLGNLLQGGNMGILTLTIQAAGPYLLRDERSAHTIAQSA
ncbi:hypothetical protein HK23_02775 [Acetobacter malorum]|uniref:Hedgehog/Intein (Hint) domain-containing protein n=1 Tax=Acetobacter malorum TaxID=178901 RepID=A0A1Y3G6D8_9PROT|nr:hypothetical protein HK23_02775 [Acetobacter malorum]